MNYKLNISKDLMNDKKFENTLYGGIQYIFKFENGLGASVIKHDYSYGNEHDLWELAVLNEYNDIHYCAFANGDVLNDLTDNDVELALKCIKNSLIEIYFGDIKEVVEKLSI